MWAKSVAGQYWMCVRLVIPDAKSLTPSGAGTGCCECRWRVEMERQMINGILGGHFAATCSPRRYLHPKMGARQSRGRGRRRRLLHRLPAWRGARRDVWPSCGRRRGPSVWHRSLCHLRCAGNAQTLGRAGESRNYLQMLPDEFCEAGERDCGRKRTLVSPAVARGCGPSDAGAVGGGLPKTRAVFAPNQAR